VEPQPPDSTKAPAARPAVAALMHSGALSDMISCAALPHMATNACSRR
jgi:hypothetical protein